MRIVKEGWPFIIGCLVVSDILLMGGLWGGGAVCIILSVMFILATAFCVYFFRDPLRVIPTDDKLILCPADGKVVEVGEGKDPISSDPVWIIHIFLSVFDPHLQRSPVAGTIKTIKYKTGKFLDARDPRAAFENEQNRIEIEPSPLPSPSEGRGRSGAAGEGIVVTQVAGLIARRIVCWVKEGQKVAAGERIGIIRFGSQVDVVLPKSVTVQVKRGDVVTAGDTILARR